MVLPGWLDKCIKELGARYEIQRRDLVVLKWDKSQIQTYLGTYFPRSYAEAYCIFTTFFNTHRNEYARRTKLSVFDFGCGTGGELIGLIVAVSEQLPAVRSINVLAFDGNQHALRSLEAILKEMDSVISIKIQYQVAPVVIDDFYDMRIVDKVMNQKYDLIITFKAICEFVTKQQFEKKNPYRYIMEIFVPKLAIGGVLCIADITTYSDVSHEWLPMMLDQASQGMAVALVERNAGYNEEFCVSHSGKQNDRSKLAYRIYKQSETI